MARWLTVRPNSYHDSVLLMRLSRDLKSRPDVEDVVVAMGTPHNRALLVGLGYDREALESAGPNDLLLAVDGQADPAELEAALDELLRGGRGGSDDEYRPRTLAGALQVLPGANLALISVPGEHAAREARRALGQGLHVMLFSDNISVADELELKNRAARRGLLMMGPDCGTAILNGAPLAFANRVRPGSIGIVGASGTGIQEISCCVHRLGGGISQAIGTGGRDLSEKIGGAMTRMGIRALAADEATRVIVVVSKPPARSVADAVVAELAAAGKPGIVQFVGAPDRGPEGTVRFESTLAEAAEEACRLAGLEVAEAWEGPDPELVSDLAERLAPGAALKGLFCGGTLAQEALTVLGWEGLVVRSNLHKGGHLRIVGEEPRPGHVVLDLGDDRFTRGRPHPMIEPELRSERLIQEARQDDAGVLLFDVVLGHGSHEDPAGVLTEGLKQARRVARRKGRRLVAIASITGTDLDPQEMDRQRARLRRSRVAVMPDARAAAELAAAVLGEVGS